MERLALDLEIAYVTLDAREEDRSLDLRAESSRLLKKYLVCPLKSGPP